MYSRIASLLLLASTLLIFRGAAAQPLAPAGCPISHCTVEATGVIAQQLIPAVLVSNSNDSLGGLHAEGCSGDGTHLTCLYLYDRAAGSKRGTLKFLNATTLRAVWGSATAPNSYNLKAGTAANGQVPVNFADGSIAAGDNEYHVRYNSAGAVIGQLPVGGIGNNYGLTPISSTYGVVSQSDGMLTLVNMASWQNAGTLLLTDPSTQGAVKLVAPSSGTSGVLYAVGYDPDNNYGVLYSVVIDDETQQLTVRSTFSFTGQSGAVPVVVTPQVSGLPDNLVLLIVGGLIGDPRPQNRLLGLFDSPATGLTQSWEILLSTPLAVSPTVDQSSQSLFYEAGVNIYQASLVSGAPINKFNLQSLGHYPGSFRLIGHLGASQVGSLFTLLLTGTYANSKTSGEQLVMEFQPIAFPTTLIWSRKISDVSAGYSGGWNFAPSVTPGVVCPIAISIKGTQSAIVRLCDH